MSEQHAHSPAWEPQATADGLPHAPPPPPPVQYAPGPGPMGQVRSTGLAIFLYFITLGIYGLYWFYVTHKEMKEHTGSGLGGPLALVLAFLVGIVMPFVTSNEAGELYRRSGRENPVSGLTGLWYFPGMFLLVLPIVWFVKTNGAVNEYWRSLGATG